MHTGEQREAGDMQVGAHHRAPPAAGESIGPVGLSRGAASQALL